MVRDELLKAYLIPIQRQKFQCFSISIGCVVKFLKWRTIKSASLHGQDSILGVLFSLMVEDLCFPAPIVVVSADCHERTGTP